MPADRKLQLSLLSCFEIFIYHSPLPLGVFTVKQSSLIPVERIEKTIYLIRGEKVMPDRDLAAMYDVTTKVFNQAVRRHDERFPADFMFPIDESRGHPNSFKVTICDLETRKQHQVSAVCLHRTRRLDELQDGAVRA